MKKKLEAELLSIAHRVLKLKGKEDVIQLQQEAHKLYEKLSILRFYEENINVLQEELPLEKLEEKLASFSFTETEKTVTSVVPSVEEVIENKIEATETTTSEDELLAVIEAVKEDKLAAEASKEETETEVEVETIEEEIEEEEEVIKSDSIFSPSFELSMDEEEEEEIKSEIAKPEFKQTSLEDFLHENYTEPEFVKRDAITEEVSKISEIVFEKTENDSVTETKIEIKQTEVFAKKTETKSTSLNDTLLKGINIGLNDRIAFVKHLFGGSNEDFNRVISQINTFDNFEEAQNFVEDMVKPDYNNWEGKEDYSVRFMNLVEKKFA
jgi:hypothetical protein